MSKGHIGLAGAVLVLPFIFLGGVRVYLAASFDWNCGEYLERAANASTIDIADTSLGVAITYAENNGLTSGNTGVLFRTPSCDVGYWYSNLKAARAELAVAKADGSNVAASNALMKLREVLTDNGEKGTRLVVPPGVSVHPYNGLWLVLTTITGIVGFVGVVMILVFLADV